MSKIPVVDFNNSLTPSDETDILDTGSSND